MEKESGMPNAKCICTALNELKKLQDYINHSETPYFGKLLSILVGVDTIPFTLFKKDGPLIITGCEKEKAEECFTTSYFRLEKLDEDTCCATVSLLRPLDIYGEDVESMCEVMKLIKTSTCVEIDLDCICAIQCVDLALLKRIIIVEPKW
ncbi:MAG: CotY/CotZ family spore coat protein [Bacillota bacterium]|uniref:CotY/CotZ family spore coat protein n=1 Tax=Rossellomorea sp. FM04394 TaxID=3243076 RepID=UPI0035A5A60B